jgi:hypothetical protein
MKGPMILVMSVVLVLVGTLGLAASTQNLSKQEVAAVSGGCEDCLPSDPLVCTPSSSNVFPCETLPNYAGCAHPGVQCATTTCGTVDIYDCFEVDFTSTCEYIVTITCNLQTYWVLFCRNVNLPLGGFDCACGGLYHQVQMPCNGDKPSCL